MFKIVALICLQSQSPVECQPDTARSVMIIGEQPNELACTRQSQMSAGNIEILRHLQASEYLKFVCERKS
jgi:hypothetical protein